jgi:hypothetical protein
MKPEIRPDGVGTESKGEMTKASQQALQEGGITA